MANTRDTQGKTIVDRVVKQAISFVLSTGCCVCVLMPARWMGHCTSAVCCGHIWDITALDLMQRVCMTTVQTEVKTDQCPCLENMGMLPCILVN